jgi:hypothetical protein
MHVGPGRYEKAAAACTTSPAHRRSPGASELLGRADRDRPPRGQSRRLRRKVTEVEARGVLELLMLLLDMVVLAEVTPCSSAISTTAYAIAIRSLL